MSDNLKKKKLDGKRISQQPWEQAYQRKKNAKNEVVRVQPTKSSARDESNHPRAKSENEASFDPIGDKVHRVFCREWETKGKPIFNMLLVLFPFDRKARAAIRRIMYRIDELCAMPRY